MLYLKEGDKFFGQQTFMRITEYVRAFATTMIFDNASQFKVLLLHLLPFGRNLKVVF